MGLNIAVTCTCDECHAPYRGGDLVAWKNKAYKTLRKRGWAVTVKTDKETYRSTIRVVCPSCRKISIRRRISNQPQHTGPTATCTS